MRNHFQDNDMGCAHRDGNLETIRAGMPFAISTSSIFQSNSAAPGHGNGHRVCVGVPHRFFSLQAPSTPPRGEVGRCLRQQ